MMEEQVLKRKKLLLKALAVMLGFLIVGLSLYILVLPFYPELKYRFFMQNASQALSQETVVEKNNEPSPVVASSSLAVAKREGNFLVIPKIGVDIPIVDSANGDWALARGAWRMPETSTPDKGSNMAVAGHRFKYLPPNNLTFYLLDKLVKGDQMTVFWQGKDYIYQVSETKIVPPTDVGVLAATEKTTLTLITCDPIWTQKNRLIVVAELVEN